MFDYDVNKGTIRAYGVIGPFEDGISETDFMQALDAFGGDDIALHLQSEGGSVTSGLSIYNQIANYSGKITVIIDALAASIASVTRFCSALSFLRITKICEMIDSQTPLPSGA